MSRKRNRNPKTEMALKQRYREIRDIYNKLRKTYNQATVIAFFERNYFIQEGTISQIISLVDTEPVDRSKASICYATVMDDNYKL